LTGGIVLGLKIKVNTSMQKIDGGKPCYNKVFDFYSAAFCCAALPRFFAKRSLIAVQYIAFAMNS